MKEKLKKIVLFSPIFLFGLGIFVLTLSHIYDERSYPKSTDNFFLAHYDSIEIIYKSLLIISLVNWVINCIVYLFQKLWWKFAFSLFSVVLFILIVILSVIIEFVVGPRSVGTF